MKKTRWNLQLIIKKKTFPAGFTSEIIDVRSLKKIIKNNKVEEDFEHITNYFYKNSKDFKIYNLESSLDGISNLSCTVDYPKDIKKITKIMEYKTIIPAELTFNQIINNLKKYS